MAKRVLLAGCGDVGLRVAQRLRDRGDRVFALRRHPPVDGGGIDWLAADLSRTVTLRLPPVDQVVFAPAPDARTPETYQATFVDGLANLLDALAEPPQRVVFVSSSAVYGEQHGGWVDEATPPAPTDFNGERLLEAERLLAARLPRAALVLRLSGIYGPGREWLLTQLRHGQLRVPRAVPHWSNRIHADDAASAIAHLLALPSPEALYVGTDDTPLPLDVLYDHLASLLGVPAPEAKVDADAAAQSGRRLRNARLRATGWAPRWPNACKGYAALMAVG